MYTRPMPFGEGVYFEGQYQDDKVYPLYIQMITCSFELKPNKIPTIQIKNSPFFNGNEYLTSSKSKDGDIETLVLSSVDLKLFFEHYNVDEDTLKYNGGWKFRAINGLFNEYIDKWVAIKNEGTITKNKGQRAMAKMMMNSLYGKFSARLEAKSKIPFLIDDVVHYAPGEKEDKPGVYLPVGIFITSYGREQTIRTSQAITDYSIEKYGKDLYYYSDTDSVHCGLSIDELKQFCDIDDVRLRGMGT